MLANISIYVGKMRDEDTDTAALKVSKYINFWDFFGFSTHIDGQKIKIRSNQNFEALEHSTMMPETQTICETGKCFKLQL